MRGPRRACEGSAARLRTAALLVLVALAGAACGPRDVLPVATLPPAPSGTALPAAAPAQTVTPALTATNSPVPSPSPTREPPPTATASPSPSQVPSVTATPAPQPMVLVGGGRSGVPADLKKVLGGYIGDIKGTLLEESFHSAALDRDLPYLIYLPPDYDVTTARYPVLYMLHGRGGERSELVSFGLPDRADEAMLAGSIGPMIIVMPQGDTFFFANGAGGVPRWGDYLVTDVVNHIDAFYRTIASRDARAIGGYSMGGWGALHNAFLHPEVFGVVGAHSPSLRPDDGSLPFLGAGAEFASKDPVSLARTLDTLGNLRIWIDIGQDDIWLPSVLVLHDVLRSRGIAHRWNLLPGSHLWAYWTQHMPDYLRFYSQALAAGPATGP